MEGNTEKVICNFQFFTLLIWWHARVFEIQNGVKYSPFWWTLIVNAARLVNNPQFKVTSLMQWSVVGPDRSLESKDNPEGSLGRRRMHLPYALRLASLAQLSVRLASASLLSSLLLACYPDLSYFNSINIYWASPTRRHMCLEMDVKKRIVGK